MYLFKEEYLCIFEGKIMRHFIEEYLCIFEGKLVRHFGEEYFGTFGTPFNTRIEQIIMMEVK